ncbi:MAG: SCP-2 sterol transfer family protein [Gammaproteobacteria bacterium]
MAELFSGEWGKAYMDIWNADKDIVNTLEHANFNSVVAFGFHDQEAPSFVMTIENGKVVSIAPKPEAEIKWDIRASKDNWLAMVSKPPGLMKLGIAYTSRKMRFLKGDYATMIRDPSLAGAFVKSFALMGKVL